MVLYRGYPYGSYQSVECSETTTDIKFFQHWLDQVQFECGGRRNNALVDGLYYASQHYNPNADNYVVVISGSEYSPCMSLCVPNISIKNILSDMVTNKNTKVSLICTRKIDSLKKLWIDTIGEMELTINESPNTSNTILQIYHGLSGLLDPVKTLIWPSPNTNDSLTTSITISPIYLLPGVSLDTKSWGELKIQRIATFAELKIGENSKSLSKIKLNKASFDEPHSSNYDKMYALLKDKCAVVQFPSSIIILIHAGKDSMEALYHQPRQIRQ